MSNRIILQLADIGAQGWYERLLDFCAARCPNFSVVTNPRAGAGTGSALFLEDAKPYIERAQQQKLWPGGGTGIPGYTCTVTYIKTSIESITLLKLRAKSPFDWVHPDLPEDLAFYRTDGSAFFVVVGHERIAYFEVDDEERAALELAISDISYASVGKVVLNMDDDELPPDSE
jgi:hypothetical protein